MYHVKKVVQRLDLSYNSIHACYNGYVIFKGGLSDESTCPKFNKSRFIDVSNQVPCKAL